MAVKPTPTQEENDLARVGQHVSPKEHDGSPSDPHAPGQPPPDGGNGGGEADNKPVITSLSPTTTNTGSQNISVRGTNFTANSKIVFNGVEQATTVRDLTWLQAMISAPVGTYDVIVRDAAGDSNAMQFTFK